MSTSAPCPCDSGKQYENCCKPYVEMTLFAPTAVSLMRSRYTAFTLQNEDYLRYSWHPDHCPKTIHLNDDTNWLGLKIKQIEAGKIDDTEGTVEFIARYKTNGKATRIHETSRFTRYEGRWVYLDGKHLE